MSSTVILEKIKALGERVRGLFEAAATGQLANLKLQEENLGLRSQVENLLGQVKDLTEAGNAANLKLIAFQDEDAVEDTAYETKIEDLGTQLAEATQKRELAESALKTSQQEQAASQDEQNAIENQITEALETVQSIFG
jgi:chromosome segregation ATPase